QVAAFDRVFHEVFGSRIGDEPDLAFEAPGRDAAREPAPADARPSADAARAMGSAPSQPASGPRSDAPRDDHGDEHELVVPMAASDEERLRTKRFEALEPGELAAIYRLMSELEIATPRRRTRRAERDRLGDRIDLRRTLRGGLHTGGDPVRLARRRRRVVPRRIVLLCDISGSMEPYARAYLRFLTAAAGRGPHAEAFVFATQLARI